MGLKQHSHCLEQPTFNHHYHFKSSHVHNDRDTHGDIAQPECAVEEKSSTSCRSGPMKKVYGVLRLACIFGSLFSTHLPVRSGCSKFSASVGGAKGFWLPRQGAGSSRSQRCRARLLQKAYAQHACTNRFLSAPDLKICLP